MGISIKHNGDGTITVTCGSERLRFFPDDDDEASADGGGSVGIPVIDPPDNSPIGYPLPGALGMVASRSTSGAKMRSVRVRYDHKSNTFAVHHDFEAEVRAFIERMGPRPSARIPIAIETTRGESVELASLQRELPHLERMVGRRIIPFLVAPPRPRLKR
jgi:hypothetical protein